MLRVITALLGLTLVVTGCVMSYDFPPVDVTVEPLSKKDFPLYYHVDPIAWYLEATGDWTTSPGGAVASGLSLGTHPPAMPADLPVVSQRTYTELERVFERTHMFSRSIATATPPEKGVYCLVEVKHIPPSQSAAFFTGMLGIIPAYSGASGDVVRYSLFIDSEFKTSYRYEVTRKRLLFLPLLPLFWVNVFTPSQDEAFRATAYQFFLDAEKDGYL